MSQSSPTRDDQLVVVSTLDPAGYAVVDLDTGTVLGTNLRLVKVSDLDVTEDEFSSSDETAFEQATRHGVALLANV